MAAASAALAAAGLASAGAATAAAARPAPAAHARASRTAAAGRAAHAGGHAPDYRRSCPLATRPGQMACMVLVRTSVAGQSRPAGAPATAGYGPAQLQSAYKLPSATAGAGQTVAVVDAYDDPRAAADLAAYRSAYGLPACGAGCFTKVNQNGVSSPLPPASAATGWATEESLDLDMVSAICPRCHIILVEASSPSVGSLGTGVNSAVRLGAGFVSNSYGGKETPSDPAYDSSYFNHPGVAVTASAGDNGYGVSYPAASRYVTAVGGTSLRMAAGPRGWAETAWPGSGSGCSAFDAKPAWQHDSGCARRTGNDVAAVADPNTGVAVYDTYDRGGWLEVGGTSASAPIIASVYALAGTPLAGSYPSSYPYRHPGSLFDVTSGSDGSCAPAYLCTGGTGYDGPTGWGTPDGTAAFSGSGGGCPAAQLLGNPGFETGAIAPWTTTPDVLYSTASGAPAHSGSWLAWLGGYLSPHTDTLAQTVTIPASCRTATLSFWLAIGTTDPAIRAYDTFTARVLNAAGAVVATLATYSNLNASGYVQHTFSLAPYVGQKITVKFTGTQTLSGNVTSFFEDDNALNVS